MTSVRDRLLRLLDAADVRLDGARLVNLPKRRAVEIGRRHYDLGNDLYRAMPGRRLVYSCAY